MDLVGALVFGEADVAVDAHHGFLWRADVCGGEAAMASLISSMRRAWGLGSRGSKIVPAGFEPDAVVVALEPRRKRRAAAEKCAGMSSW